MNKVKLLALSGSLRRSSHNTAALQALQRLAPADVQITLGDIATLPLFNPDREGDDLPPLAQLKSQIEQADGLIIASPEYAHGISGPMKNALDWLVSGAEFPGKPIMLINTSPRASHAQAALREVLTTMSGIVIDEASVEIPLLSSGLALDDVVDDLAIAKALSVGLDRFCEAIAALDAVDDV